MYLGPFFITLITISFVACFTFVAIADYVLAWLSFDEQLIVSTRIILCLKLY